MENKLTSVTQQVCNGGILYGEHIRMKQKISVLLAVAFASGMISMLAACSQYKVDQQLVAEPDPVALRLSAAVDKATAALQTLAAVEQSRNPGANLQMPPTAPVELRRIISVDWTGPIEPIARTLAD